MKMIFLGLVYVTSCFADLSLSYNTGKFIAIDKDYAEVDMFVPFSIDTCKSSFVDASVYRFNNDKWAFSLGTGLRTPSQMGVWGANVYYDYLRGERRNDFHRLGAGVEWLNGCWDVRVNGYLPVGGRTKRAYTCHFDQLGDGYRASQRKLEYAYTGIDAEVGVPFHPGDDFTLYGAAGPYYYSRTHHHHLFGGFGRLELDWKSLLSLQVRASYDNHYKTQIQGLIQISLPLDFFYIHCSCDESLFARVKRLGIILTDSCCDWSWNWND